MWAVDLGIGIIVIIIMIITVLSCFALFLFLFFYGSFFVSFSFSFLEFIKCVCGLGWMCCGGGVVCYVECTNVVKKWQGSDCDNLSYQGRRG